MKVELRGKESQCPMCDRVFKSDRMCEMHKKYGKTSSCVDPTTLGMETRPASGERGFDIWTKPIPEEMKWWKNSTVEKPERSETQTLRCRDCGIEWERPSQRGRPPVKCETCKSKEVK